MRIEVRERDGAVTTGDGFVHFVAEGIDAAVGAYVMTGDDLHPVTRYDYDAELLTVDARLFVRVRQYQTHTGARTTWYVSDDMGRTWRLLPSESAPADAITTQRVHSA